MKKYLYLLLIVSAFLETRAADKSSALTPQNVKNNKQVVIQNKVSLPTEGLRKKTFQENKVILKKEGIYPKLGNLRIDQATTEEQKKKFVVFYPKGFGTQKTQRNKEPNLISVWSMDTIDAYLVLNPEEKNKAAILVMANANTPGGKPGSPSQEEQVVYRTNLQTYLDFAEKWGYYKGSLNRDKDDLLKTNPKEESDKGLYVHQVMIIRSNGLNQFSKEHLYPKLPINHEFTDKAPYTLFPKPLPGPAVIMSAAYSLNAKHYSNPFAKIRFKTIPEIIQKKKRAITNEQENSLLDDYEKLMKSKMRFQLRAALANNKTVLILGAFGCGSFANPPEEVARLYKEVLEEPEFNEAFEHIIFANLVTSDRDMDNFRVFSQLLVGMFPSLSED